MLSLSFRPPESGGGGTACKGVFYAQEPDWAEAMIVSQGLRLKSTEKHPTKFRQGDKIKWKRCHAKQSRLIPGAESIARGAVNIQVRVYFKTMWKVIAWKRKEE